MARATAMGSGPVVFFTKDGRQIQVPLAAIYFDYGAVGTSRPDDASSADLLLWLEYLAANGRLVPGETPPAKTALVLEATDPGAHGNAIVVTTATVVPATNPRRADITVSLTDRYPDLRSADLATLDDLMGSATKTGAKPGLLRVKEPLPANPALPTVGDKPEADRTPAGGVTPPASWTLSGAAGTELVLEPSVPGDAFDDGTTVVSVETGSVMDSVTLVVTWSATVPKLVATDDFTTKLAPLRLLVKLGDPPADGFTLPRDGAVPLSGGADPADAVPAAAMLLAID